MRVGASGGRRVIFEKLCLQMKVKLKRRNGGLEGGWGTRLCDTGEATHFVISVSDTSSAKASFREIYFKTED